MFSANVATKVVALVVLLVPVFVNASPLAWDGGSAYSGASSPVNGGSVSGGGGINLIKILSHNAAPAGESTTGPSWGGNGGDRHSSHKRDGKGAGGSAGGAAYSGAAGSATGGNAQTDPEITVLDLLSDNAAAGGLSRSGPAIGGNAGNIL